MPPWRSSGDCPTDLSETAELRDGDYCRIVSGAFVRGDPAAAQVEFNPAFLQGGDKVDVSRFSKGNPVLPGDYVVDQQINGKWVGRASVRLIAQPDSDIALPCIDRALVDRMGLDFEKLSPAARSELSKAQSAACVDLKAMIPDAAVAFDMSQLRLDISVPQVAMLRKPRGYVSPEFWDGGVPSATLGYHLNAYRSATSYVTTTIGHLDVSTGFNFGSWHLRQRSSVEISSVQPSPFPEYRHLPLSRHPRDPQRPDGGRQFHGRRRFRQLRISRRVLASDDQMLPDSQREYAPVVRGIAQTNARVVITQNGNTILETTVAPGTFEINDLYATGYGGDLSVTVHEADGSQNTFTVPYASVVQLLRPGVWRYSATAGEVQHPSLTGTERFTQATVQRGFNNMILQGGP